MSDKKEVLEESITGSSGYSGYWNQSSPDAYQPGMGRGNNPIINPVVNPIQQTLPNSPDPNQNTGWNNTNRGWGIGSPQDPYKGIQLRCCERMFAWQQAIITNLQREDQCILAKPAVGKTMPIMCYWANTLLGLNVVNNPLTPINQQTLDQLLFNPELLPQVLWLVPIQALSDNILSEVKVDFTEIITQILNQEIQKAQNFSQDNDFKSHNILHNKLLRFINNTSDSNTRMLAQSAISQIDNIKTNQLYGTNATQDPIARKNLFEKINNLDKELFDVYLTKIIKDHVEKNLVGEKYEGVNTWQTGSHTKPFVIAVYESAKGIINQMSNLRLLVFDEFQRLLLSGVDNAGEDKRATQIMNSLDSVLSNNRVRNNSRLAILSGTTSEESAKGLLDFFNTTYGRNFKTPAVIQGSNIGNISINAMSGLDDINTQIKIIKAKLAEFGPRSGGVVFVILNKKRIDEILDRVSTGGSYMSSPGASLGMGGERSSFNKNDAKQILGPASASDIKDPLLRRAVASGVGRIYRLDDAAPLEVKKDNQIVQQLFLRGEIKVLLATESIREGINIKAKVMYISTVESMGQKISLGNLCQLLNRVGREPGFFRIYVANKDIQYVEQALNANPSDFQLSGIPPTSPTIQVRNFLGHLKQFLT